MNSEHLSTNSTNSIIERSQYYNTVHRLPQVSIFESFSHVFHSFWSRPAMPRKPRMPVLRPSTQSSELVRCRAESSSGDFCWDPIELDGGSLCHLVSEWTGTNLRENLTEMTWLFDPAKSNICICKLYICCAGSLRSWVGRWWLSTQP